jgi:hypothetical protein
MQRILQYNPISGIIRKTVFNKKVESQTNLNKRIRLLGGVDAIARTAFTIFARSM